tara:strand:- start:612 stop:953 length:342 start_codon:yes stop_codon:yes gene_type:complete
MKKFILIGLTGLILSGCEVHTVHYPHKPVKTKTTVVETVVVASPPPTTVLVSHDPCGYDDPMNNYDLEYMYCSWDDGYYCTCEMYYNFYTGCEEEWCFWDNVCGWEPEEVWCY